MKNKLIVILMIIMLAVIITPFNAQAVLAQSRIILFPVAGKWYICQGYNTNISHTGKDKYALDLSPSKDSFSGSKGCSAATNTAAQGRKVFAPASGTVTYLNSNPDIMQLKLDSAVGGGCIRIAHFRIKTKYPANKHVNQGQLLGTLSGPSSANGYYAHLHISVYSDRNCTVPVAIAGANNFRIFGAANFKQTTTQYAYRGQAISYTAPPINFDGYCESTVRSGVALLGDTVYDWKCTQGIGDIDPDAACKWQYYDINIAKFTNENDPYSWGCYPE